MPGITDRHESVHLKTRAQLRLGPIFPAADHVIMEVTK
jgi:hypothetical protein